MTLLPRPLGGLENVPGTVFAFSQSESYRRTSPSNIWAEDTNLGTPLMPIDIVENGGATHEAFNAQRQKAGHRSIRIEH